MTQVEDRDGLRLLEIHIKS